MTLGEKIQKLRKQNGLSQETLAEKVTVTRQTISKWELNQSTPDLDFIAQLSNIFCVSSDYLIRDEMEDPDILPPPKKDVSLNRKRETYHFNHYICGRISCYLCMFDLRLFYRERNVMVYDCHCVNRGGMVFDTSLFSSKDKNCSENIIRSQHYSYPTISNSLIAIE